MIIENAKKDADIIIFTAKKKEKEIIELAIIQAEEIKKKSDSEIRFAARQFISGLKQQVIKLITTKQTEILIKKAFKDDNFIKQIILTIVKNWDFKNPEKVDVKLLLPLKQEKMLEEFFRRKGKAFLDSGSEIYFDSNLKSGFRIESKDGSYYISFTDKVFENYFKNYLKPQTKKMLFE